MPTITSFVELFNNFLYADHLVVGLLFAIFLFTMLIFISLGGTRARTINEIENAKIAGSKRLDELEVYFMERIKTLIQAGVEENKRTQLQSEKVYTQSLVNSPALTAIRNLDERQTQVEEALTKIASVVEQIHNAAVDSRNTIGKMQDSIEKQGVYMYDKFAELSEKDAAADKREQFMTALAKETNENFNALRQSLAAAADKINASVEQLKASTETQWTALHDKLPADKETPSVLEIINDLRTQIGMLPQVGADLRNLRNDVIELSRSLATRGDGSSDAQQQLSDLLSHMLPAEQYSLNEILPNGAHVSALVCFPAPSGAIAIDASVSLKAYNDSLQSHLSANERANKQRAFGEEIIRHVNHVADMLIAPPHTGDSALLFVPSEAAFSDIHAHHREAVDLAVSRRIWLVSPTTLLAVLNTAHTRAAMLEIMREAENFGNRLAEIGVNVASGTPRDNDGTRLLDKAGQTDPPAANPKNQFMP